MGHLEQLLVQNQDNIIIKHFYPVVLRFSLLENQPKPATPSPPSVLHNPVTPKS